VRVRPSVEEDQVTGLRPDDRAGPFDRVRVRRGRIVREDEFTACPRVVIGAEEQPGQGVGIDVAFEAHRGSALDVQHDAVPVVEGGQDGLGGHLAG